MVPVLYNERGLPYIDLPYVQYDPKSVLMSLCPSQHAVG